MSLIISRGPAGGRVQLAFGDYVLDSDRRELRRGSVPVALEPQVFDLLLYLVQNRDRVVTKDDLIATVWKGRIVSDSTLTTRINAAQKAVGDSGGEQALIKTYARKGIRFVADVRPDDPSAGSTGLSGHSQGMPVSPAGQDKRESFSAAAATPPATHWGGKPSVLVLP